MSNQPILDFVLSKLPSKNHWEQRSGYIAGHGYTAANAVWFAFGLTTMSARELTSSVINLVGGRARAKYSNDVVGGIDNFGNKVGAAAGFVSQFISTLPGILAFEPGAIVADLVMGAAQLIDFRSGRNKALYGNHKSVWLRETLGQSRRLAGFTRGTSRLPLIIFHLGTGNLVGTATFTALLAADIIYAFSQPRPENARPVALSKTPSPSFAGRRMADIVTQGGYAMMGNSVKIAKWAGTTVAAVGIGTGLFKLAQTGYVSVEDLHRVNATKLATLGTLLTVISASVVYLMTRNRNLSREMDDTAERILHRLGDSASDKALARRMRQLMSHKWRSKLDLN